MEIYLLRKFQLNVCMYNRLFIPYPSPNVMSFQVKHIFRNFINKDRSVHRDSDGHSLQPCMLHPHLGLNLDAEGSPRNWLVVLAHAFGYLHLGGWHQSSYSCCRIFKLEWRKWAADTYHVLEALQLDGVAQRVEVGLHSPVRLVTERLKRTIRKWIHHPGLWHSTESPGRGFMSLPYLGDELLVPGGGCGLVEAHRAPREHAAHGVDVNRSLENSFNFK